MKMKMATIAALAAAQLSAGAVPAQAADPPRGEAVTQARPAEGVGLGLDEKQTPLALAVGAVPAPLHATAAEEEVEPRKKRKSTGDKVLTGAAVVLGIGALAVGGLLVAIFVN